MTLVHVQCTPIINNWSVTYGDEGSQSFTTDIFSNDRISCNIRYQFTYHTSPNSHWWRGNFLAWFSEFSTHNGYKTNAIPHQLLTQLDNTYQTAIP